MPPICYVNVIQLISVRQSDDAHKLPTQHTSSISGSLSIHVCSHHSVTKAGLSEEQSQPQALLYNLSDPTMHKEGVFEKAALYSLYLTVVSRGVGAGIDCAYYGQHVTCFHQTKSVGLALAMSWSTKMARTLTQPVCETWLLYTVHVQTRTEA